MTLTKNATRTVAFVLRDTSGVVVTGATLTCTRSLNGAAFAACTNAATEIASGWYALVLTAAELNADVIALHVTATGTTGYDLAVYPSDFTAPADAQLDRANAVLTGLTPRQALRVFFDLLTSGVTGAGTASPVVSKAAATIGAAGGNRMTATTDASGNRSSVTVDPT